MQDSSPRVLVSAYALGDRVLGAIVADSVRAMLARQVPRGSLHVVADCEVRGASNGAPLETSPTGRVWPTAAVSSLARSLNLASVIEVGAEMTPTGGVHLAPVVYRVGENPQPIDPIRAADVQGAARALALRVATDLSLRRPATSRVLRTRGAMNRPESRGRRYRATLRALMKRRRSPGGSRSIA